MSTWVGRAGAQLSWHSHEHHLPWPRGRSKRLVLDHGSDTDDDPARFRVTITLDQLADGKTVLTLRQFHPTVEQRDEKLGFGAVELGPQTMHKLARYLAVA